MTTPDILDFFHEDTNTFTYVVIDPATRHAAIVDSVLDYCAASGRTHTKAADAVIAAVRDRGLTIDWILETHVHADHLSAAPYLQEKLGGQIAIGSHVRDVQKIFTQLFNANGVATDGSQFGALFDDGTVFNIGELKAKAIHTPGHTPACMSYLIGDAVFVGDTLFSPDFGTARCDFPGGDARALYQSIQKLFALPDTTRVFLCHDYLPEGRDQYIHQTTIGEEKANNIHVGHGASEDEFVKMRTERDATLSMPKLILPSVQVNMRAGRLPEPEDNGIRYVKIPLDAV
ncbi:MBL fold metallo-hydrolase [Hyphobacterium sp. CCMP332]|uniref:MBL fold metallo-hydrolase n=1 Tax=Hyphobacterium sp. CCMP332 TaxID=2749086 RepID=UPI00164F0ADB|nr:MBL fold metallo-hydrolase [Hyphobacterium sp. CCMP332]QNL18847.1 MBL fold metallo-hydrolase [Hyphobacterium sp. CCMP332]